MERVFGNLVRISLILSFQESLFLSETLEKITFNPGLSGKLLLILENELETSPSTSTSLSYRDMEPDVDDELERGSGRF